MKNFAQINISVVWLKRDLRLLDHAAFNLAEKNGFVIALSSMDKNYWSNFDSSTRHKVFYLNSLYELAGTLKPYCVPLYISTEGIITTLIQLKKQIGKFKLYSHQETGNWTSYLIDQKVKNWCNDTKIQWIELKQNNVIRNLADRNTWTKDWRNFMNSDCYNLPKFIFNTKFTGFKKLNKPLINVQNINYKNLCKILEIDLLNLDIVSSNLPKKLSVKGQSLLNSFLNNRALNYKEDMSSPLTAEYACSRLSPFLSWGLISIRTVYQELVKTRLSLSLNPKNKKLVSNLFSFEKRLHWRCHFIQKLESEPEIEFRCLHNQMTNVRNEGDLSEFEIYKLECWKNGKTGVNFVDACMNYLRNTGWINFRMRAMLISFASHNLWIHWTHSGKFLAKMFLDYEPGIHWPQVQMQSGTTGINTIRIYNPNKQMTDHDPKGIFTNRWGSREKIDPIIDVTKTSSEARSKLWNEKKKKNFKDISKNIFEKHGSRLKSRSRSLKKVNPQIKLI